MKEALGLIEVIGLTNGIVVADAMAKTANITIQDIEITKGCGYVTVKITGDVGAVNAAISSGKALAIKNDKFITSKVIPRPADVINERFLKNTEVIDSKITNKKEEKNKKEENKKVEENKVKTNEKQIEAKFDKDKKNQQDIKK